MGIFLLSLSLAAAPAPPVHFERDVRPILKAMCFHCHGEEDKPKGKLDLRLVRLMHKGGRSGPAVVAGQPDKSPLFQLVASDEMPSGEKKLTAVQKATIRAWIAQGGKASREEPANPADARFTDGELAHWSFQPVKKTTPPAAAGARTAVDAYVLDRARKAGIAGLSPEADRRTLIRRLTFDLTGLPPTPEEVTAFVADARSDAYERLVDRLLASPRYGERWGRHWLDVAGFAETDGSPGNDRSRPEAWRYRDYVVRAFNADKPFDRFVTEQLAGDEIAKRPFDARDGATMDALSATGFLRMAPDATHTSDTLADRNQAVADTVRVFGSAMLGMTLGCAQCHDHRYDPIAISDYYKMRAFFDPAFDLRHWKTPTRRSLDVTPADVRAAAAAIDAEADKRKAAIEAEVTEFAKPIYAKELAKVPEADRKALEAAVAVPEGKRTPAQKALAEKYPSVKPVSFIAAVLTIYDGAAHNRFQEKRRQVEAYRATKPAPWALMTVEENPAAVPVSKVFHRGDPEQPREAVTPGEMQVLSRHLRPVNVVRPEGVPTTGRRLALAKHLTSGRHPLTARVFVNRIWMHHFGAGLVRTPGDFGLNGERPTHPELLDYLAADFAESGWQVKQLHRQILRSAAYRQSSRRTPELDAKDPENRLVARMNIRRLAAEEIRDAMLAVSGEMNPALYGPSIPVAEDFDGKAVFGKRIMREGLFHSIEKIGDDAKRRSVYVESKRALPLNLLETFDLPVMTPNCDQRRTSTVATQSLLFLNDEQVVSFADATAERVSREASGPEARVKAVYARLFGAEPSAAEADRCAAFLREQEAYFRANGDAKGLRALAGLCQALMCSNRFLYVD